MFIEKIVHFILLICIKSTNPAKILHKTKYFVKSSEKIVF